MDCTLVKDKTKESYKINFEKNHIQINESILLNEFPLYNRHHQQTDAREEKTLYGCNKYIKY